MWAYDPKDATDCLPEGSYDFELKTVEETISKTSNKPMLEIEWMTLRNDKEWIIRDYIVNPTTLFKLKAIANAWGLGGEFDAGVFDMTEHIGKIVHLKIAVQKGKDGYQDRNNVMAYGEPKLEPPLHPSGVGHQITDDQIPF